MNVANSTMPMRVPTPAAVIGGQPFSGPNVIIALSAPLTVMMQRWIVEISLVPAN